MTELRADGARLATPVTQKPAPSRRKQRKEDKPPRKKRRGGLFLGLLRLMFTLALLGTVGAGVGGWLVWQHYSKDLPDFEVLREYQPAMMSRVYAGDSRLLAELATERRIFVPIDAIPPIVQQAFISAEDQNFWTHRGVDPMAVLRAIYMNLQQIGQGRRPVGASTITQQVAKNMLLTNETSIARKIREAILALRIEEALPKQRILELYLNEIFLGARSYGVAAAAQAYFNKSLDDLTLAEAAFLAILPKAPSNYDPFQNPDAAVARRNWVLDRMAIDRAITREQAEAAKAEPLRPAAFRRPDTVPDAGYFAEEVRRQLIAQFGEARTTQGGLLVRTTLNPAMQAAADRALRAGLIGYDRRKGGWRGPVARIEAGAGLRTEWLPRLAAMERVPGMLADWQLAVVLEVSNTEAKVSWLEMPPGRSNVAPQPHAGTLYLADSAWARPRVNNRLGAAPRALGDVLRAGDVVMVEPAPVAAGSGRNATPARPDRVLLRQIPQVRGALVALDPATGRVQALSGGWSFEESQFNRATQAQRQPGSSFKPFVYMAAVESGISPAESMLDAPFVLDLGAGGRWRPSNYSQNFNGMLPLYSALAKSLNLITIRLADRVGLTAVADVAHRFGVVDNMPLLFPAALGAVETTPIRMAGGYAVFANGGRQVTPTLIDSVQDRDGQVVWRAPGRSCQGCDGSPTQFPVLTDERQQITSPLDAYTMTMMLQIATMNGTGTRAAAGLGRVIAGKTGTTNDYLDAWYVGYTPDLVVAVWVGFDTPTPLGSDEAGGVLAAPIFRDFMAAAMAGKPALPFRPPAGVVWNGWPASRPDAPRASGAIGADDGTVDPSVNPLDTGLGGIY